MTIDQEIAVATLVTTIIVGVAGLFAYKAIKKSKFLQKQAVGDDSLAIQSGRDTRIEK